MAAPSHLAENVFWVPREVRWEHLQANARQPEIGKLIDDAMVAIERENPQLKGVLSKDYARPTIDKTQLGEPIDLIGTITMGEAESRSKDIPGRVYEYFLGRFAGAEGKGGGELYTARCVVRLLVEMIEPFKGRVYDPCSGSGGMFVHNPEAAARDVRVRENLVRYLEEQIAGSDSWPQRRRDELVGTLRTRPGLAPLLRASPGRASCASTGQR